MPTEIRPELSKKNKYWIPKHRYYELKHFVMQYPEWSEAIKHIDSMVRTCEDRNGKLNDIPDPVGKAVEKRAEYAHYIYICDKAVQETDKVLGVYILNAVVNGYSYDELKAGLDIPCCRDVYYELYRKFFYILNDARK